MKIESHLENLKESIREIEEAITQGLVNKQRTLGFHTSAGAADIIEIILHKNNLIDLGFIIKHEWFNSKRKIEEKLNFEFPKKKEILDLAVKIEFVRNSLCYGKRQEEDKLEELVSNFNKLKEIFLEVTDYEL
ncbi:MAG: hypothetical protein WCX73_02050 [Candidatus Pacearchaeota archaeon]|jgi:hypothetical protein